MKTVDKLAIGDNIEKLEFCLTHELNKQLLDAIHCDSLIYKEIVHPTILIGFSNITRSPSYIKPDNVATIHTHDNIKFMNIGKVGNTFTITWNIIGLYEKKNKKYQIKKVEVTANGKTIITRTVTDTHIQKQN